MRRMTEEEIAYYAKKQEAADIATILTGIIALIVLTVIAVIGASVENNIPYVCAFIAIIPIILYIIRKGNKNIW